MRAVPNKLAMLSFGKTLPPYGKSVHIFIGLYATSCSFLFIGGILLYAELWNRFHNGAWSTGVDPRKAERDAAKAAALTESPAEETETEAAGEADLPGEEENGNDD